MKKILFYALIMLCTISCGSKQTNSNNEELRKAREAVQFQIDMAEKQLAGKRLDFMTRCVSVDFDNKDVIYTYEIDEDYATIEQMRAQKETYEQAIKSALETNPQTKVLTDNLKIIGGKIVYNYVGDTSKKVLTITLEP